jgi:hypothetical protein
VRWYIDDQISLFAQVFKLMADANMLKDPPYLVRSIISPDVDLLFAEAPLERALLRCEFLASPQLLGLSLLYSIACELPQVPIAAFPSRS